MPFSELSDKRRQGSQMKRKPVSLKYAISLSNFYRPVMVCSITERVLDSKGHGRAPTKGVDRIEAFRGPCWTKNRLKTSSTWLAEKNTLHYEQS